MSFKPWNKAWWIEKGIIAYIRRNKTLMNFFRRYGNKVGPLISAIGAFLNANPQYSLGPFNDVLIFLGGFIMNLYGERRNESRNDPKVETDPPIDSEVK